MEYKHLNWETLGFVKDHLYHRLADSLNKVVSHLELARSQKAAPQEAETTGADPISDARRNLEILKVLIKSWALLIHWKINGSIPDAERRPLERDHIPGWFMTYLNEQATVRLEHTRTLKVQTETFLQGFILLIQVAKAVGDLSHVMSNDAEEPKDGVWLRIVFTPPKAEGYQSRLSVLERLNPKDPAERDILTQFAVADDLFALNNARFSLQKNIRTGHQAFAILLPSIAPAKTGMPAAATSEAAVQATPATVASLQDVSAPASGVQVAPTSVDVETAGVSQRQAIDEPQELSATQPVFDDAPTPSAPEAPLPRKVTLLEVVRLNQSLESVRQDPSTKVLPANAAAANIRPDVADFAQAEPDSKTPASDAVEPLVEEKQPVQDNGPMDGEKSDHASGSETRHSPA
jgi:hypothetical protein